MIPLRRGALRATLVGALLAAAPASGQPVPPRPTGVPSPGRAVASVDDASAIAVNPANLAFLPSGELRWTWVATGRESTQTGRGHAFDLGFPLPLGLGTGLRLDIVRPPAAAPARLGDPYGWLTWGLGWRPSSALSLGLSAQRSYSQSPDVSGLSSFSLAMTQRPVPALGLSFVARDLNAPSSRAGLRLGRSYDVAAAVRPTGRRALELGLEGRYLEDEGWWVPRATIGADVPYVGRLRGEISTSDPRARETTWTAMAGIELGLWSTATVEGGAIGGTGVGGRGGAGFWAGTAAAGFRRPGLPEPDYALKVRIEETPSARGHVRLLRRLWDLSRDPDLRAVALVIKAEPADSLARAEEIADAIRVLQARDKKVVCHLEDAGGRALYACAGADRVAIHPGGGIRFAGLKLQHLYFASLMEKIGVRAQFVRVGEHKSAPERFTRQEATDVARADTIDLLHEHEDVYLDAVAGGRRIPRDRLRATLARGPFVATEAKQAGLVDAIAFDDEVESVVAEAVGRRVPLADEPKPPMIPQRFGRRSAVAIVYVDGDMVDGRSKSVPLIGTKLAGSYTIAAALDRARKDPSVGAVVVRVESPGGSSMAADVMWREVALTAKAKPTVVSMGSYAASGGYYLAAGARPVWANALTITGSIGVFYGKADVAELFRKIGVGVETFKTAPRADAESLYRPFTPEEMAELERKVKQFYDVFVDRVARGRGMTPEQVDAVGRGRVWTGRQARARGLVDHVGGLRQAIAEARRAADLSPDAPIVELPVPETSLLELLVELAGGRGEAGAAGEAPVAAVVLPREIRALARALAPFTLYGPYEPLARMETTFVEEP